MPKFSPIAIVGRSCIVPGALKPAELWDKVIAGADLLTPPPSGHWRLSETTERRLLSARDGDRIASGRGGYVRGFCQVFDTARFGHAAERVAGLDAMFQWVLWGASESLLEAGHDCHRPAPRAGLVLGNLGYPSSGMAQFAEAVWMKAELPDVRNRFPFGLPPRLAAEILHLGLGGFSIDAACSSSLYAIKLACDRLHDCTADLMVAGGVNRADDLFLHCGFTALNALSPTGQSRPFHRAADGLVPAEGAAFVALKRLEDAAAAGDRIYAVIRSIGLGNDGRSAGLLAPAQSGQVRAMRAAYAMAELHPADISLIECHATGTQVGDAVELASMKEIFDESRDLVIGSLKSNLGHLITAAGAAGLIKVTEAIRTATLPPTRRVEEPASGLLASSLRVIEKPEPWNPAGPRRAAVSAFGFGGNNAHLIVEEWNGELVPRNGKAWIGFTEAREDGGDCEPLAIVGLGVLAGNLSCTEDFARAVLSGDLPDSSDPRQTARQIALSLEDTHFPPRDLEQTLPQQLMLLAAAQQALQNLDLDALRTGIFTGMEVDPEITRYAVRWRLEELLRARGEDPLEPWLAATRERITPALEGPARIVGNMPSMVANRLNSQFNIGGPGFAVGAGEDSGSVALELATRALRKRELDTAIVGAVDLSCNEVHHSALHALRPGKQFTPGDAAVVLVLQRLSDAERNGSRIYAILNDLERTSAVASPDDHVENLFGDSYAASDLLRLAAAAICCQRACQIPSADQSVRPWLPNEGALATTVALGEMSANIQAPNHSALGFLPTKAPRLFCYSGAGRTDVLRHMKLGVESDAGPALLTIVASSDEELRQLRNQAEQWLAAIGRGDANSLPATPRGIYFREAPLGGDTAFVFTGAAAAYSGMGDRLLAAVPELANRLGRRYRDLHSLGAWINERSAEVQPSLEQQLRGCSLLCQLHAELTRGVLAIKPEAVMGISSGETNSLFAMGAWQDIEQMFAEIHASGMYELETAGQFAAARRSWKLSAADRLEWTNIRVLCPYEDLLRCIADEPHAHVLIIHAPDDCLIGGDTASCARVLEKLGSPPAYPTRGHIVHCPEMLEYAEPWLRLHTRPTAHVPGVRFYANAIGDHYELTKDAVAANLLQQAVTTIDFPRTVLKAWDDGVRIFIEHGPRNLCSEWIGKILGDRPHLAVPLDRSGSSSVDQAAHAVASLVAAGLRFEHQTLFDRFRIAEVRTPTIQSNRTLTFAAHPQNSTFLPTPRSAPNRTQSMEPTPILPHLSRLDALVPARTETSHTPAPTNQSTFTQSILESIALAHQQALEGQVEALALSIEARLNVPTDTPGPMHSEKPEPATDRTLTQAPRNAATVVLERSTTPRPEASSPGEPSNINTEATKSIADPAQPRGPQFSREQLEIHASGRISTLFGPMFHQQDGFAHQVRMPYGPLLLADRITGLVGEPGSMGLGSIWTETDVRADSWFLREGRVPAGILIEAGQADLFLISYLGADFLNRDERKYRMLSCDVTFHGELPKVGDTLCYDIHVDAHAKLGDIRIFFFHFDCRVNGELRLSMRGGQAGFFTDRELAETAGVLWSAETASAPEAARLDPPVAQPRSIYSPLAIETFTTGDAYKCFGPGYELAATHTWSPRIGDGRLQMLDEVTSLDPSGGPWKQGYMRAVKRIAADEWFFDGHFKNDPCMPGTLMIEAAQQAIGFYMAALGFTLRHDGWRFEPVVDNAFQFRCRGQVTPRSREVVYEIFVREVVAGPMPTIYADVLGTIIGENGESIKGLVGHNVGVRLVPDWPLGARMETPAEYSLEKRPAAEIAGIHYGSSTMFACAVGQPSLAFGEMYRSFDGPVRVPRLPAPPYHFVSRIRAFDAEQSNMATPASVEAEYDIPADAWYFANSASDRMPVCVLLEAALQPCGWLASYIGCAKSDAGELFFRNLDGAVEILDSITPDSGTLLTKARLLSLSRFNGITLLSFEIQCFTDDRPILRMTTSFGFFVESALASQAGLPTSEADKRYLDEPANLAVNLRSQPAEYFDGTAGMAQKSLAMLDRVTGFWPQAGAARLGRLRAEKDVDPEEWFFKAHFFQDPVMPGTLGIESMTQLLQFYMLNSGLNAGLESPRFEVLTQSSSLSWKYRGQVLPHRKLVTVEVEIREVIREGDSVTVIADGWLWVDGVRIYQCSGIAGRFVSVDAKRDTPQTDRFALDPDRDPWIQDHCPNFVIPTMPLMEVANRFAQAAGAQAPKQVVTSLRDVRIARWIALDQPRRFQVSTEPDGEEVVARLVEDKDEAPRSQGVESLADAVLELCSRYPSPPAALPALANSYPVELPYSSGAIFHGPAFQILRSLHYGDRGSTAMLDAAAGSVPIGLLHTALLDSVFHAIPNDNLSLWYTEVGDDLVALPHSISWLRLYQKTPVAGLVRCEVRADGFDSGPRFPAFRAQLLVEDQVWADLRVVEILLPKGPIGRATPEDRRGFLRDRCYAKGLGLSHTANHVTELALKDVLSSDWLPGSLAALYQADGDRLALARSIAVKDHIARLAAIHPSFVTVSQDLSSAVPANYPLSRYPVSLLEDAGRIRVADSGLPELDLPSVRSFWSDHAHAEPAPQLAAFFFNLCRRFVKRVVATHPARLRELHGKPVLFLANHQAMLESFVFSVLGPVITGTPVMALAKKEQRDSLLVQTSFAACSAFAGTPDTPIVYFDRSDPSALLPIMGAFHRAIVEEGRSVMVHVEGVRGRSCRTPVQKISGSLLDLAIDTGTPIVPVRFVGGLPVEPFTTRKLDFPWKFGAQEYILGDPIQPEILSALNLRERKEMVLNAINELGPKDQEVPFPGDSVFEMQVRSRALETGVSETEATLLECAGLAKDARIGDFLAAVSNSALREVEPSHA
jgi:PfaB family protein